VELFSKGMSEFVSLEEAAQLLNVPTFKAKSILDRYSGTYTLLSETVAMVWHRNLVLSLRKERFAQTVKRRKRASRPRKSNKFDVNECGEIVEQKRTFRGRVCRKPGCDTPVPTGKLYCDEHSYLFKMMQKKIGSHGETYSCPVVDKLEIFWEDYRM
jgi:hypothetical protein